MPEILHLHTFKCAGTTFENILQQNYGEALIKVESSIPSMRLPWQCAQSHIELKSVKALTSHLISLPSIDSGLARIYVTFMRDPQARLRSSYVHEVIREARSEETKSFEQYLLENEKTELCNFQARHASPQSFDSSQKLIGWEIASNTNHLDRSDIFFGIVEWFDESMVALEYLLEVLEITFDGSYGKALNVDLRSGELAERIPEFMWNEDAQIYIHCLKRLWKTIDSIPDFERRLKDFKNRCALKKELQELEVTQPINVIHVSANEIKEYVKFAQ